MHHIPSSRQNHFSIVPSINIARSAFNCDHGYKTTFNAGYLIPFLWDEVNPGDTFKVSSISYIRFATLLFPLMDNVRFYTYYFFCPTRLIWDHSRQFFGEQATPSSSIDFTVPKMTSPASTGYLESTIYDYLGLPTGIPGYDHISLPLRAYNLCWNEWFRDQNLQNSVVVNTGDTSDSASDYTLLRSCKIRDYFTSCLPFAQKFGSTPLPLGSSAPVVMGGALGDAIYLESTSGTGKGKMRINTTSGTTLDTSTSSGSWSAGEAVRLQSDSGMIADLSSATAATINSLRQAFQIQRFKERDARNGTRYAELVHSHFGVHFPDLHYRPLYLGGSSDRLHINVVAQTSGTGQTGQTTPIASLSGFGTAVLRDKGFTHSFTEHGIILGLLVARADINYQQGLNRKWSRSVRYDYPWPVLAHLGEQAVLYKEIYTQGTNVGSDDDGVFGYQERYAENRYFPNLITSLFRSSATGTLDSWHLAQDFGSKPTLGDTFIVDNPPTSRVKAVEAQPDFIMDMQISQTVVSMLPTYSDPGYIDHF